MKAARSMKLLARALAVPAAWFMAINPSAPDVVAQGQNLSALPTAELPPDRLMMLHSLLGGDMVPSDLSRVGGIFPRPEALRVAGVDQMPSPPPPSPPPP
jgi:hypothetical protein